MRCLVIDVLILVAAELEYELVVPEATRQGSNIHREELDEEALEVLMLRETDAECFHMAKDDLPKWAAAGNHIVAACAYPAVFSFKAFAAAAGLRKGCLSGGNQCDLEKTLNTLRSLLGEFKVKMYELVPSMRLPLAIASTVRRYVLEEAELITAAFQKLWSTEALQTWIDNPLALAGTALHTARYSGERRRILWWRTNMLQSVVDFGLGHLVELVAPRSDFLLTRQGALEELLGGPPASGLTLVEVGVHLARLAFALLGTHPGLRYIGVDPFAYGEDTSPESRMRQLRDLGLSPEEDGGFGAYELSSEVRRAAEYKLNLFGNRAKLLAMPSVEAAAMVPDQSVDGVFIDGDHSYHAVVKDIDAWEPKVKQGGFLSGHDFGNHPDVARAVLERAAEFNRTVHLSMDWFWYYYL